MHDTIYAPASGAGRGGITVIRLSGPDTQEILRQLTRQETPVPRRATRARFFMDTDELIDDGIVLWFPAPASYTGEDVAELHVHGGRAVWTAMAEALTRLDARMAEPGEFSKRAFINNKMDLTQAEAVADLVAAETAAQRRQALRQMEGALGQLYEGWHTRLKRLLAYSEAMIDFSDEDLPEETQALLSREAALLYDDMSRYLNDSHRGERLREGLEIALVGAPNTGKSTLLNRLAGREAAIVSTRAGTTRDIIEVRLDLDGYPVILADMAGLREAEDDVEQEGIRRALARAERADLRLALFDSSLLPQLDAPTLEQLLPGDLVVFTKRDLGGVSPVPEHLENNRSFFVSVKTEEGLDDFLSALSTDVARRLDVDEQPFLTRQRHREALMDCLAALQRGQAAPLPELAGEDFRLAMRALGRITGRVDVEDLLDIIFRDFCIGK